jgi:WD40 repeat protein
MFASQKGFNFNGTLAATGGMDGLIKIWNVDSGALVQDLQAPDDIVVGCRFLLVEYYPTEIVA